MWAYAYFVLLMEEFIEFMSRFSHLWLRKVLRDKRISHLKNVLQNKNPGMPSSLVWYIPYDNLDIKSSKRDLCTLCVGETMKNLRLISLYSYQNKMNYFYQFFLLKIIKKFVCSYQRAGRVKLNYVEPPNFIPN